MRRAAVVFVLLLFLSGCSIRAHSHEAALKVAHFHELMNAGKFDQIVVEAGPAMNWPTRGPSFKDYLAGAHRKLGFCGSWQMLSYVETFTNRGRVARLNADTRCDRDNAQESFIFTTGPDMRLRGYAVTSRVLVVS
jgi:hypothetical protein